MSQLESAVICYPQPAAKYFDFDDPGIDSDTSKHVRSDNQDIRKHSTDLSTYNLTITGGKYVQN